MDEILSMINTPPFFDKAPSQEYFDLNSKLMEIQLPEILDSSMNFCMIQFESASLGETFYSSCSEEIS